MEEMENRRRDEGQEPTGALSGLLRRRGLAGTAARFGISPRACALSDTSFF